MITKSNIESFEFKCPNRIERNRISNFLWSLENKIENNHRINTNLELQAQALYKQWFVDNRCDDWEIKSLSDLMDYQGGSQPPASEFIDKPQDGYVRFVQIRDYASNSHPTYIPIAKKNKLCNKKDIMIARYGASLGRICFGLEGAYNVALAKVKPLENYYREFLRCYLSSNEFYDGINMKGNRAVQAGFNQSDINSFMISCPKQDIFVAFENIVSKILDKRLVLQQENETLATLRDTLLPKLMNGEIKI
jgi:type I restriction enzyme S subunit